MGEWPCKQGSWQRSPARKLPGKQKPSFTPLRGTQTSPTYHLLFRQKPCKHRGNESSLVVSSDPSRPRPELERLGLLFPDHLAPQGMQTCMWPERGVKEFISGMLVGFVSIWGHWDPKCWGQQIDTAVLRETCQTYDHALVKGSVIPAMTRCPEKAGDQGYELTPNEPPVSLPPSILH